jgi:hypothetical protein
LNAGEKSINGGGGFKFAHNASQCGTVMVDFGIFHSPLTLFGAKEIQHNAKDLVRVIHYVCKCLSGCIRQEVR